MQPFLLMKQTLEAAFDPGPLLLYGPNAKFTSHTQTLSKGKSRTDATTSFTAGMRAGSNSRQVTFETAPAGLRIARDEFSFGADDERITLQENLNAATKKNLRSFYSDQAQSFTKLLDQDLRETITWDVGVERNRCFLEPTLVLSLGSTTAAATKFPGGPASEDSVRECFAD